MLSFRKKNNEPIPRKLTNRWKDGQTLFYKAGGPKSNQHVGLCSILTIFYLHNLNNLHSTLKFIYKTTSSTVNFLDLM